MVNNSRIYIDQHASILVKLLRQLMDSFSIYFEIIKRIFFRGKNREITVYL